MNNSDPATSTAVRPVCQFVEGTLTSHPLPHPAPSAALDSRTIRRAKLGDIDAFTLIVETYYPRSLRFARSMLHDADEAEDVVQETFVRLYRAMPRYEERQRFESWLFQILGNCCRTANTASQRRVARAVSDDELLARIPAEESARRGWIASGTTR